MTEPKIKYDIEAAVKGEADAASLGKTLRGVGDVLEGDLQQGALAAAQALEALGSKQRAIESFRTLKNETGSLAIELAEAEATLKQVDSQLGQASAATQQFAQVELQLKAVLEAKRSALTAAKKSYEDIQAETIGAARKTDEYRLATRNARDNIQQLSAEIKQHSRSLKESEASSRTAQQAENALSAQYQKSSTALIQTRGELISKNAALDAGREKLRGMGLEAANLAQAERNLQGAVAQVRQEVAAMAPAYQQAAAASSQSTQVQAQNQRTLRDGMTSISTQLQRIQQIATVALGGSYAGGLAKSVADTADEFRNLEARVKLATGEGPQFQTAFEGVTRVALATNSALDETGTLFARLAKAGQEAGQSAETAQRNALQLTETINQTIQLSGGSADSAKAAITQLIQGLQSGVLRGEEFNSVMEQAPRLAQALANGLGVTTGELRKMANQGALTADVVMKSLQGQADVVAGEFSKLPPTVGRALQNLTSQWTLYVGASDNGLVSSANAAKVINALAGNLDTLVSTLTTAGKLWAAMKIAGLASDFGAWALKTLSATTAVEANTAAVGTNTVAQRGNSAAIAANAAAQAASTSATVASTAAKTANAASWASIATFAGQATKATQAATVATAASTVAVAGKTAGMGLLGGALRGVTSLLGGPVGLIATVVLFSAEIKRGANAVFEWGMSFTEAGRQIKAYEDQQKKQTQAEKLAEEARKEAIASQQRQNDLYDAAVNKSFGLSKAAAGLVAKFNTLREGGDSASDAIGKIGKDFDLSNVPGIRDATAVLDKLVADGRLTSEQFSAAWATALDGQDLAKFEVLARTAFSGAAREGERLSQMLDATVREAVRRSGLDFEQLQGKIGATSRSALNDLDAIVGGLGRLKEEGVDTGRVLSASFVKAIDTADSQQAIDAVRARVEQLRSELGNKVADGLLDQARQKALDLKDAVDQSTPGVTSLREAMRLLGVTSDETLKNTATQSRLAYDSMVASGTASARELSEGFRRAAQEAIDANKGIAPSWVTAQAAVRGFSLDVDSAGKTAVRSMKEAEEATRRVGSAAGAAAGGYQQMGQSAADAADRAIRLNEILNRGRVNPVSGSTPEEIQRNALNEIYDRNKVGNGSDKVGKSGDVREAAVMQYDINQDIAKRYGDDAVGNDLAEQAWQLRQLLQSYQKNYGGARSQQSLLQQRNIAAELTRVEAALKAAMGGGGGGGSAAERPTPAGPSTGTPTVVNINYEGARHSINTDAAGAQSLQNLIRQLQDDKGRA